MARRPNPDGWKGGSEDFETVLTLKGSVAIDVNNPFEGSVAEMACIQQNHGRLCDAPGFDGVA